VSIAEKLLESEERLRETLEAAEVGTWEWDIARNEVTWSPNIERIFGIAAGTFAGTYEAWLGLVHPEDRSAIAQEVERAVRTLTPYDVEVRVLRGDGSVGWQAARGHVTGDIDGRATRMHGVVLDITARKAAESALKMPARVLESMTEGVSLADDQGIIRYTNPAEDRMFGYAPGELIGQHVTVQNAYPPDENRRIVDEVMTQLRTHGEWHGEWANKRKDGSAFVTRASITALELDGRMHWLCVQQDVTNAVRAREREAELGASLRASEARYRAFVAMSSEGIWRTELRQPLSTSLPIDAQIEAFYAHGYLAECNDAMAQMYGYERAEELVGKRLGELLIREDPRNHAYLGAFIDNGYRLEGAESHEHDRDGKRRVFRNSLVGVVEDGMLLRAWGTQRDVTVEVEALRQVEAANRAKDEFLALLGHELRNPLAPILTALELMKLRDERAFSKERAVIERQLKHVVRLVDDLLDVSRITRGKVSLDMRRVSLADVLASAIELTSPLIEQRAHTLSVDVPRDLHVEGDPTRLAQVFANVLTNAAKYTPQGGRITVEAASAGDRVRTIVRDDGIGIRAEMLPRIFDLFVQERQALDRADGGLGLGLAIARSLVEAHGGSIEARSSGPERGTELIIELPASGARAMASEAPAGREDRVAQAGRRVLVVDDNEDAAALLGEVVREWGHDVRIAHDGPAALNMVERFAPDVALLDIGLPAMDGYELARRLRELPQLASLQLVAITGYGQAQDRARAEAAGFDRHLVKPVDLSELEKIVRAAV